MGQTVAAVKCFGDKNLPSINQVSILGYCLSFDVSLASLHRADVVEWHIARPFFLVEVSKV